MVLEEIDGQPDDVSRQIVHSRVLRALREHPLHRPEKAPKEEIKPMTDGEALRFEREPCPFEKHRGKLNWAVPIEYLCRLTDPSDYIRDVKRYLLSDRGKKRIEQGG